MSIMNNLGSKKESGKKVQVQVRVMLKFRWFFLLHLNLMVEAVTLTVLLTNLNN
jgi:hypothetical protein